MDLSPENNKTLKSFSSLDAAGRNSTLNRLSVMAKSGNKDAQSKLALLIPLQDKNLPKADNFAPQDFGSKLGTVLYGIREGLKESAINAGKTVADLPTQAAKSTYYLAKGDVAGAARSQNESYINKQYGSKYAGDLSGLGNAGSFALDAAGLKGGGAVLKAGVKEGLKQAAIKGVKTGASFGAGYGVTQSATANEHDIGKIFTNVATNAAFGAVAGGGIPAGLAVTRGLTKGIAKGITRGIEGTKRYYDDPIEQAAYARVRATGEVFKNALDEQKAATNEIKAIESDPKQVQAIKDVYKASGNEGITAETGRVANDISPVKAQATSAQRVDGLITPPKSKDGAIYQTIDETLSTPEATSRAKQYDESLQKTIKGIEGSPGYQASLSGRGGGEVISNVETIGKAKAAGPLDHGTIKAWQAGAPVDAVTLVRAKATLDAEMNNFTKLWESGRASFEQMDSAHKNLNDLESGYHVMSAEPGRATQIQNSFVNESYKRLQKLRKLDEQTKGVSPEKKRELIDKEMADFDKQAEDAVKTKLISKETATKLVKVVEEWSTSMKLTSPLTHAVNTLSSIITAPVKAAENVVSIGIGAAQGRTSLGQVKYVFGTMNGLKAATKQFVSDVKQTINPHADDLVPDGTKTESTPAIPGVAGKVIRTPFNALQAADNFWKSMFRDSEMHQRAFEMAHSEGFRGSKRDSRISEIVDGTLKAREQMKTAKGKELESLLASPYGKLAQRADDVSKEFTFTNELGTLGKKAGEVVSAVPGGRLVIPFIQTPTNIVKFQAQRHPVGVFSPRNIQAFAKGNNLERRDAVARLSVGTGMALGGMSLAFQAKDNITGAAPSDSGEKDLFYAQGKKPFSIKIGDRWVNYNRFQPVGLYLSQSVGVRDTIISIQAKNAKKGVKTDSNDLGSVFVALATTTASSISDLPFVTGMSSLTDLLNNPTERTFNKFAGGTLSGLFPNVGRDVASAGDDLQRNARTVGDKIKLMIPGKRQEVAPRIGVDGRPQKNDGSPIERGFVKITSKSQSNKLTQALTELGKETGYYPDQPKITSKVQGRILTPDEFAKYQDLSTKNFATKLGLALNDVDYKSLNKGDKQATIEKAVRDSRTQAAEDLFGKADKAKSRNLKKY